METPKGQPVNLSKKKLLLIIYYGGNHVSNTDRTFTRPLCEQELVLSPVPPSDHHTGQTSLRSRRLLGRFSGKVLNTQVVIPGL